MLMEEEQLQSALYFLSGSSDPASVPREERTLEVDSLEERVLAVNLSSCSVILLYE
jgi:hypothetical protein